MQAVRRARALLRLPVGPPPQRLFPQCRPCSVKQVRAGIHTVICTSIHIFKGLWGDLGAAVCTCGFRKISGAAFIRGGVCKPGVLPRGVTPTRILASPGTETV
jgi:hypothetical protein